MGILSKKKKKKKKEKEKRKEKRKTKNKNKKPNGWHCVQKETNLRKIARAVII